MHLLSDLLNRRVAADGKEFPIKELFASKQRHRLRYAAIDAGGWFSSTEVLVALSRFAEPGEAGPWPAEMSRTEIENAPRWEDPGEAGEPAWLPPLIVGPFGGTYSPLLLRAQMEAEMQEGEAADDGTGPAHPAESLDRAGHWIGRDCFGPSGHLGKVRDVELDEGLVMRILLLDGGERLPLSRLRHVGESGHAVFDDPNAPLPEPPAPLAG